MLNVYLQNKISGIHIMNTAVSNNSQALRERFAKDVSSYTADKVFILIGTNDLFCINNFLKKRTKKICSG